MPLLSRSLLAFVAVAEELHFGRAAKRLHMTQPPLSQQIAEFERAVGATLLLRTTRSVQLTPAGQLLLQRARQMMAEADAAIYAARQLASGEAGRLALGFTHSTVYQVLPRLLMAHRRRAPGVELELRQFTSDLLIADLRSGRLDLALARLSPSMMADLETMVVGRDRMVVLMPADHALARYRRVPPKALHGLAYVDYTLKDARYFKELADTILATEGVRPKVVEASFLPTLFALVEAGMGVALAPESAVKSLKVPLAYRPLAVPARTAEAVLYAAWRPDNANSALPGLLDLLGQLAAGLPRRAAAY